MTFTFLDQANFSEIADQLFSILYTNMSAIAPTGNSFEADYSCWFHAVSDGLNASCRTILLLCENGSILGYFQYYTNQDLFVMEELQIAPQSQGTGAFRAAYGFLLSVLPEEIKFVEAYSHKLNQKSQGILKHLGLDLIGENKNGSSYHYRGAYADLCKWYHLSNKKPAGTNL